MGSHKIWLLKTNVADYTLISSRQPLTFHLTNHMTLQSLANNKLGDFDYIMVLRRWQVERSVTLAAVPAGPGVEVQAAGGGVLAQRAVAALAVQAAPAPPLAGPLERLVVVVQPQHVAPPQRAPRHHHLLQPGLVQPRGEHVGHAALGQQRAAAVHGLGLQSGGDDGAGEKLQEQDTTAQHRATALAAPLHHAPPTVHQRIQIHVSQLCSQTLNITFVC